MRFKEISVSPLAPKEFPHLPPLDGVRLAVTASGLKPSNKLDLLLIELAPGSRIAAMLTRSRTASAPVLWCREALIRGAGYGRGIVVNSGNANAFTGHSGQAVVQATLTAASNLLKCPIEQIFVASTGVIGQPVSLNHIPKALPKLHQALTPTNWLQAAQAITTTDTFPKQATRQTQIGDQIVTINGIAKGSGMIAPDMATMLSFIVTDACLSPSVLQALLRTAVNRSFNCITVDGDTSTSDTVLLAATGRMDMSLKLKSPRDPKLRAFRQALEALMIDLAQQIVCDGEGAQKFITIKVNGAVSARAARRIGLSIANSPLVKTAIAGEDANWGRIVMAVGKSGEEADRDRLAINIGGVPITEAGQVRSDYDEVPVALHLQGRNIEIAVDVGARDGHGRGRATLWSCDLTHGYIAINADYRS